MRPDGYINTDGKPITLAELKGKKVVLLDVWTYSCINCQRTLPYVTAWYNKYKDQGLEIIGLHTPEFSFEKVKKNVEDAMKRFGIKYPVVLDNEYATWNAYGNQYWPRKYLIDVDGYIVYDHIGEGNYDETEAAIQKALEERNTRLQTNIEVTRGMAEPVGVAAVNASKVGSPEVYFGSDRNKYLANGTQGKEGSQMFVLPPILKANQLYLNGAWSITPEYSTASAGNSISFKYSAKEVYMVASGDATTEVTILLDGKPAGAQAGVDINSTTSIGAITQERLYKLIKGNDYGEHTIEIKVNKGKLKAFTFTFG